MERRYLAVSAAIIVMWLAVLCISIFAPELHHSSPGGDTTSLPVAGIVAATFAFIATIVIGAVGFGRGRDLGPSIELRVRDLEERAAAHDATAALTAGG
jgi:hypothetical protein